MLEPVENQYMRIGRINRSHGVQGEVSIISEIDAPELFEELDLVNLQNSRGDFVPARIESVRIRDRKDRLTFFVKFEHVTDRNQAEAIKGYPVYVERRHAESLAVETERPDDYTDFEVYDEEGRQIGRVETVLDNPAHPILQIASTEGRQLLVPLVDEYITSTDDEQNIVRCQNLEQLKDL